MNDIEILPYSLPLRTAWKTANASVRRRDGFLLKVGDAFGDAAALPGATARMVLDIRRKLSQPATRGLSKPMGPARHALLQAALTQRAFDEGQSLAQFLGGGFGRTPRNKVPVNATLPIAALTATVAGAKHALRRGFDTLKLKVGGAASEVKRVAAVRAALGPKVRLRVDPNGSWTKETAPGRLADLEPEQIDYVEQPLPAGNPKRLVELASRSPVSIAPDEDATSRNLPALLRERVLEHVVLKPMMLGGPDIATEALRAVEDAGATPIITDVLESGVGRAAALHVASLTADAATAHGLAGGLFLRRDLVKPGLVPLRGSLRVPETPGLGLDVRRPR